MSYKVTVNAKKYNPNIANSDLAHDVKKSRLHEIATVLRVAILKLHFRERDKLIKKINCTRLYNTNYN